MENRLRRAAEPAALAALTPRAKALAALSAQGVYLSQVFRLRK